MVNFLRSRRWLEGQEEPVGVIGALTLSATLIRIGADSASAESLESLSKGRASLGGELGERLLPEPKSRWCFALL